MHAASVYSSYDRGVIRGGLSFALLPRLGERRHVSGSAGPLLINL